ncbi:MAG TPA: C69 family dipeptidase, partial [Bacillota bacterium]|nr:C69 family dipeptidase [Bacillota bacterium]
MRNRRTFLVLAATLVMLLALSTASNACTIIAVGNKATVDGSALITHNDDSGVADFRLWILKGSEHKEGETRPIVIDSHDYIDYSKWPEVDYTANRNKRAMVLGEIPQPKKTYTYFHSRYSFINENGVAMGESTTNISTNNDYGKAVRAKMYDTDEGLMDCWNLQDIALERATTSREAVMIMGDLVTQYGWNVTGGGGEIMDITDGTETWAMEFF